MGEMNPHQPPDRGDGAGGWPTPQRLLSIARINASSPSAPALAKGACAPTESGTSASPLMAHSPPSRRSSPLQRLPLGECPVDQLLRTRGRVRLRIIVDIGEFYANQQRDHRRALREFCDG